MFSHVVEFLVVFFLDLAEESRREMLVMYQGKAGQGLRLVMSQGR